MRFQLLCARLGLVALVLAAIGALVAVAGVRLGLFAYQTGLTLMVPASALGVIALICAFTWMARALKRNQGEGKRMGLSVLVGALLLLWPPLHTLYNGLSNPPLNDVSSDPEDPPRFVVLAKRAPGMNSPEFDDNRRVTFQGKTGRPSYILHEFEYSWLTWPHAALQVTTSQWFWRNFETVKRMGWTIIAYDEKQGRIEATTSSFWFGQVTDIVIRIERAGLTGARLNIRAQSENSTKDFGHNLALLKAYFRKLNP